MTDSMDELTKALAHYDLVVRYQGCGDGGCIIEKPQGMHTNGGCRCSDDRHKMGRVAKAAQKMADAIRKMKCTTEKTGD